ncbi:MAG TPA: HAD family hydrolase [Kaistia sp.]|nr:HAD family hydrolase [Kaistia sp.]
MSDHAITAIGFDADDTLWQNEHFYRLTEQRFTALLEAHGEDEVISSRLLAAETRNLALYGFGIKGFTLSMIETAIEVTEGRVDAAVISEILAAGRELLTHPVETLPHARDAIERLSGSYRIILITKGDLFDQERKLAQSGLGDLFDAVEIVSDKTVDTYRRVFARHADGPERALMVGNSLKSDIAPAIGAGGWGVYVPHPLTWSFEYVEPPTADPHFRQIADLGELPDLVRSLG